MITEKKTKLVEVEYWTCHNPDHNHRHQFAAESCIEKHPNRPRSGREVGRELRVTWLKAARLVLDGATFAEAGRQLGSSSQSVGHKVKSLMRESRRFFPVEERAKIPALYRMHDIQENPEFAAELVRRFAEHWNLEED